jgi:hypothetical protein
MAIKDISKIAGPIAAASYGYDIYQDINKYDGADAAKAVTVTTAATGVTIGAGLLASGIGAPVGVVVFVGVGVSVVTTIVADRVKEEWIGE